MRAHSLLAVGLVACVVASTGCRYGQASFTSTVPGRAFEPDGTVFAYLDEHDSALVEDKDPRVVVVATWIIFDPTGDLNDLEGSALEEMRHELTLRDAFALVFDSQKGVDAGKNFKSTLVGDAASAGKLSPRLHFAPERLTSSSTYGDVKPLASKRAVSVGVERAFDDQQTGVSGTMTVKLSATSDDPGDTKEGEITGTFTAPLVSERVAEQNLALLDVEDVLGLPLPARGE
jgi:hypothetical protein